MTDPSTTDDVPFKPETSRHATLTAVAAAEEQHDRPVAGSEIIEAADELGILEDYAEPSIRRRMTTLYFQGYLNRQESESGRAKYAYSVADAGETELKEHGRY